MNEGAAFAGCLEQLINNLMEEVRAFPDDGLAWQPPAPDTNCAAVIAKHSLEFARQWVWGIAGGQEVVRDRPAEFASPHPRAEIEQLAAALLAGARPILERLTPAELDEVRPMPPRIPGEAQPLRGHLLHAVEHLGTHLGHIQLTRQWYEAAKR